MDKRFLQECPVCGGSLMVKVLQCPSCHTRIEGDFEPPKSRLLYLPKKDLEFIELFIRVRGNIKEMEKALGVSYPTVRGMLEGIIEKMGYPVSKSVDIKKRAEIIDRLERGEINAAEAAEMLKSREPGEY